AVEPAGPLPSALTWGPILVADRFVEAKDRLQRSESERHSLTIRSDHQRKVPEEALARMDQPTKSLALGITWELELGRVVNDQHAPVLRCAASRLPKVGRRMASGDTLSLPKNRYAASNSASSNAFGKLSPGRSPS